MNGKRLLVIRKTATAKNTLLLGVVLSAMSFFIMPETARQIRQVAPGTELIDGLSFLSPGRTYDMIAAYGEKGRKLYFAVELSADLVFSLVIAAFLCSLLVWSASKRRNKVFPVKYLILLPFTSLLAGWLENAGIIFMLAAYPEEYGYLPYLTFFFTLSKWAVILVCSGWALLNLLRPGKVKSPAMQCAQRKNSVAGGN